MQVWKQVAGYAIHVVAKISSDTIQTSMNAKGNDNEKLKVDVPSY